MVKTNSQLSEEQSKQRVKDPFCPRVQRVGELWRALASAVLCLHNSSHVGNLVCGCVYHAELVGVQAGRTVQEASCSFSCSVEFPGFGGPRVRIFCVLVVFLLPDPGSRHSFFPPDCPG